ncbi:hypothetical protein CJF43_07020 [Pseudomonas fragi]|uniref:Uncharacterized protein n=1 Tax=Pseudomonas fragi TaxID=296 RepID=A0A266LZE6_PSEFR|nr:hypothetical protein CJF43_07020 [Pseudomonas fragi]
MQMKGGACILYFSAASIRELTISAPLIKAAGLSGEGYRIAILTGQGSGVLHALARAVVPAPRLRAKLIFFSAVLRLADSGQGCGQGREFWNTRTLRIPAKAGLFDAKE